jgi:Heavy metal binding domain
MSSNQPSSVAAGRKNDVPLTVAPLNLRWWIEVARVRLRFFLVVAIAVLVAGQWPVLRGVWERWTWGGHRHASGAVSSSHEYFCPMDAGVVSVWPAICPICNMDLVPRKKMEAQMLPEGVVARMQLSPYRIQLGGIRTSLVEPRTLKLEQTYAGVLRLGRDDKLGFQARITASDVPLLSQTITAEIQHVSRSERASADLLLEERDQHRIRFVLQHAGNFSAGDIVRATVSLPAGGKDPVLAVPESAVIDRGRERLVYVESMPGMFDGVAVELGRRCGSYYPVTNGLRAGQRVATAGAFLIDAETRLNPGLAAGYFGANQSEPKSRQSVPSTTTEAVLPITKATTTKQRLSLEDQKVVEKQRICPVTELALDSMGGPVAVMVSGRRIFVCCAGCTQPLKEEPDKYLAKLKVR